MIFNYKEIYLKPVYEDSYRSDNHAVIIKLHIFSTNCNVTLFLHILTYSKMKPLVVGSKRHFSSDLRPAFYG